MNTEPPISTRWKWATTKYVSLSCQSTGNTTRKDPSDPADDEDRDEPDGEVQQQSSSRAILAIRSAIQLKIFTPRRHARSKTSSA